jgi:hypothetical protein
MIIAASQCGADVCSSHTLDERDRWQRGHNLFVMPWIPDKTDSISIGTIGTNFGGQAVESDSLQILDGEINLQVDLSGGHIGIGVLRPWSRSYCLEPLPPGDYEIIRRTQLTATAGADPETITRQSLLRVIEAQIDDPAFSLRWIGPAGTRTTTTGNCGHATVRTVTLIANVAGQAPELLISFPSVEMSVSDSWRAEGCVVSTQATDTLSARCSSTTQFHAGDEVVRFRVTFLEAFSGLADVALHYATESGDQHTRARALADLVERQGLFDLDWDAKVDFDDFFTFADVFGRADIRLDENANGQVDFDDFFVFANRFGLSYDQYFGPVVTEEE